MTRRYAHWWFESESDERFKASGYDPVNTSGMPEEGVRRQLEFLERQYGPTPKDLRFSLVRS